MTYQTDVQGALWFQFVFFSSGALECTAESIPSPSLARKNHTEAGATRSPKVAGFSISALTASSKTSLHLANARQLCAMRKLIGMAARLIPLALIASVASCQSGRSGGLPARGHRSLIQTPCLPRAARTQVRPRGQPAAFHRAEEGALPEGSDSFWTAVRLGEEQLRIKRIN